MRPAKSVVILTNYLFWVLLKQADVAAVLRTIRLGIQAKSNSYEWASPSNRNEISPMKILLTNDDGIHSGGIIELARKLTSVGNEVFVVAPRTEQSGISSAITFLRPLFR